MNEYLFLYVLSFLWILFAVFQDLKYKEISNWLTFSLIAFVLAYRAIYSSYSGDYTFFFKGLFGVLFFVAIGYGFYYSRVFAGGDAKLLFGLGGIFPYQSYFDFAFYGIGFIFLLLASGVIYTLIYSSFIAFRNKKTFVFEFKKQLKINKFVFYLSLIASFILLFFIEYLFYLPILLFLVFVYVKAIETSSMIKLISPHLVTEGDWLYESVKVGNRNIETSVHGLSYGDILYLRKHNKKVKIKLGIPFAPAFLIAILCYFIYSLYF
jgi:Flp pilus assembly protein protease CpaA